VRHWRCCSCTRCKLAIMSMFWRTMLQP
jgi:hypothetical protein